MLRPTIIISTALIVFYVLFNISITSVVYLWSDWTNQHYTHGFLILALSLYIFWKERSSLKTLPIIPDYLALPFVFLSSFAWFAGIVTGVQIVHTTVLVFILFFAIWSLCGRKYARICLLPVGYLLFAMPVWEPLMPLLQKITAYVSFNVLNLIDVPSFLQGIRITIPEGVFLVQESCSGLRYLNASLALGVFYAYQSFRKPVKIFICMALAFIIPIIANWLRVTIIIYAGHLTDMTHSLVHDHINFGWLLYIIIIFPFIYFGSRYIDNIQTVSETARAKSGNIELDRKSLLIPIILTSLFLCTGPGLYGYFKHKEYESPVLINIFPHDQQWVGPNISEDSWHPEYLGVAEEEIRVYKAQANQRHYYVYIGVYSGIQDQNSELINVLNSVVDNKQWTLLRETRIDTRTGDRMVIESLIENTAGERRLVWHWYHIAGTNVINGYKAKILQLWSLLFENTFSSVIAIATPVIKDEEKTREILNAFINVHVAYMEDRL